MAPKQNIFEVLVEKYRFWIGGILILAIVGGSGVLIYRENYSKPKIEDRIAKIEEKIGELENKSNKIQETSVQANSNTQISNIQTEQGQVAGTSSTDPSTSVGMTKSKSQPTAGKININTATLAELDTLVGIGPAKAKAIIDYRASKGGFKSIDELDNVSGIGKATIDKFRDQITI